MTNALCASQKENMLRIAAASPSIRPADIDFNTEQIIETIKKADGLCVDYLALPELCLTGATLGALYDFDVILKAASDALLTICKAVRHTEVTACVGLPYIIGEKVQSCAALLRGERVYAILPLKQNRTPFGFTSALYAQHTTTLTPLRNLEVTGGGAVFEGSEVSAGNVMLVQSCANAKAGSLRKTREALCSCSARTGAAIAYASPNGGESGTSFVFDGYCAIAAGGEILAQSEMGDSSFVYADVDTAALCPFEPFLRPARQNSYLPEDPDTAFGDCLRILELQAAALVRRITHINGKGFVLGISGGLDSALAILAAARACQKLGWPSERTVGITMPGFGSSKRTRTNAKRLVEALGCEYREIDITEACRLHFKDIGHDETERNSVYENAQARERTQILLDISNKEGLLDVGTGDLSEAALGWTTFGGDHLAQYGVNASLPKTVIRKVTAAAKQVFPEAAGVLQDILDTPVSPELLPTDQNGEISQKTESLIGSYELHDLFIYEMIVNKESPKEIFEVACEKTDFPHGEIYRVLGIFLKRFFAQQFKRTCAPEAPDILVSISPLLFPFPSDMSAQAFIREYESIKPE